MEFTVTERGKPMLIKDGYTYLFQKTLANEVQSYECVLRRKGQCKAKVKLSADNEFLNQLNDHTHPPSQTKVEATKVKAKVKERASTSNETPQQVLAAELQNVTEAAIVSLPCLNNVRRNIRRQRENNNDMPPIPASREDMPVLPDDFQRTERGDRFLLFDSGVGDVNRIIIFATDNAISLLAENPHWFMDGTFKVCPEIFFQVYTVHALLNNQTFPCVFALLPNKTEESYNRFLSEVLNAVRNVGNEPDDILVDFERAALNAANNQLNQIQVRYFQNDYFPRRQNI